VKEEKEGQEPLYVSPATLRPSGGIPSFGERPWCLKASRSFCSDCVTTGVKKRYFLESHFESFVLAVFNHRPPAFIGPGVQNVMDSFISFS
jgi:hypothetical protein